MPALLACIILEQHMDQDTKQGEQKPDERKKPPKGRTPEGKTFKRRGQEVAK